MLGTCSQDFFDSFSIKGSQRPQQNKTKFFIYFSTIHRRTTSLQLIFKPLLKVTSKNCFHMILRLVSSRLLCRTMVSDLVELAKEQCGHCD